MIIENIMNLVYSFFELILNPSLAIPAFPEGALTSFLELFEMLFDITERFCALFLPRIAFIFLPIVFIVESNYFAYKLIMWILRKIPMLGLS